MYPSNYQLVKHPLPLTEESWLSFIKVAANERPLYKKEGNVLQFGQVAASFAGIPQGEDEYYSQLSEYVHSHGLVLLSEDSLFNKLETDRLQTIQTAISSTQSRNPSINDFVLMLEEKNFLLKLEHPIMNLQIKLALIEMLKKCSENEDGGLVGEGFVQVFLDVLGWTLTYLDEYLYKADPEKNMPAFLWYGNYTKSHQYLLFFLLEVGCDVISFTPAGGDALGIAAEAGHATFRRNYPKKRDPERFPAEQIRNSATVAYRASKEIENILTDTGGLLYKSWQLRDYVPSVITLKTTYEELFMVAEEKAMVRPYFEMKDKSVSIPALFAKINGVSHNRREYWKRLHRLILQENAFLVKTLPFSTGANSDFRFHYHKSMDREGFLDPQKMSGAHYWKYHHMPEWLQTAIATAIRRICANPWLKAQNNEKVDDVRVYLFTQGMQIPENILKMLQKFDYSQEVPKVIIYNNELNGSITRPDAALLLLLNQLGADLVIYNPAGRSDIEKFIDKRIFVSHWLEDVVFDQELREPSVMKKIIMQGLFKTLRSD
ncbi:YceG family protein [Mesobacillus thioparans]|uniref:YceG family protein n=1 Tax=Mesobacillus thioparans TaxID=370439 RepID=UPI0039EF4C47